MQSIFSRFAKPSRSRGVRRREVFSAQFDGGQSVAAYGTTIHLGCDTLERRIVLTASESDFVFSQGTITGYTGAGGVVDIPSTIHGKPVVVIGDNAFKDNASITGVVIPNSVVLVGEFAFYHNTSLKTVTIGNGVTYIGDHAFDNSGFALTSVTIGNQVTRIGDYAFAVSGLQTVVIPNSVKTIGNGAFEACASLKSLSIPNSVTSIGNYAFKNTGLTSVTIGNRVRSIGSNAFEGATALKAVIIPNSVISIGEWAFANNRAMTKVIIGTGVTSIGACAFLGTGLTSVAIPRRVTNISICTFQDCTELKSVSIPNSVTNIGSWAFQNTRITSLTIGVGVTNIGSEAFLGCTFLKSVTFTANAPTVGADAFKGVPFGAKAIRAVGLTGYGRNGDIWNGLIVWTPGRVAAPTVSVNTASLAQNLDTCTIKGTGFLTGKPSLHQVTFNNGAVGTVTAATATTLTVKFTKQVTSTGRLTAIVTSVGGTSGVAKQVATVVSTDNPEIPFPELLNGAGAIDSDAPKFFAITPSGLRYRVLRQGSGAKPSATGTVTVNYRGWLDDGKVFDSSNGVSFKLNQLIIGFAEGMQLVGKGGMIEMAIPSNLAYGSTGAGDDIPPNATTHWLVELLDVR